MKEKEQIALIDAVEDHWRQQEQERRKEVRIGWWMAAFLAVGTVLEYGVAIAMDWNLPIMVAINVAEAVAIIVYFMHLPRVWRGEEH